MTRQSIQPHPEEYQSWQSVSLTKQSHFESGAKNSAILAIQILATSNDELQQKLVNFKEDMKNEVLEKNAKLNS